MAQTLVLKTFNLNSLEKTMSDQKQASKKTISETAIKLAESLKENLSVKKGVLEVTEVDGKQPDLYEQNLPDGLTLEVVGRVNNYDTDFIAAGAKVFGELSLAAMSKDKQLNETTGELGMYGKNNVSYHFDRTREHVNPTDPSADRIIKHGVLTTKYEVNASRNNGDLKRVRNTLMEEAMNALKG